MHAHQNTLAVIAGASGLVGRECLDLLLERYETVTALVRRPLGFTHPRLVERRMEFDKLGTIEIPAQAHVFCALGTTIKKAGSEAAFRKVDFEYALLLAKRAAAAGGARFMLISSVGASAQSKNFYLRVKGELEDAVRGLPLDGIHIFRPSFLMGDRTEPRSGEKLGIAMARVLQFALLGPLRKYRPIRARVLARAMVNAAQTHGIQIYHYDEMVTLAR
jgi:uncharacterized protein YbjT (DUF2867 family)